MPRYMLDTKMCMYLMKNQPEEVANRFSQCYFGDVVMSSITYAELQYGVMASADPERERINLNALIEDIQVVPFDDKAAIAYGQVMLATRDVKKDVLDKLIAAHALSLDVIVVTNNVKDFSKYPGIKIENWVEPNADVMSESTKVIIGDSDILFSLAKSNELDLLLSFSDDVSIAITDYVEFEITQLIHNLESDQIRLFREDRPDKVSVMETDYGKMVKHGYLQWQAYIDQDNFREMYIKEGWAAPKKPMHSSSDSTIMLTKHFIQNTPEDMVCLVVNDDYFIDGETSHSHNNFMLISCGFFMDWLKINETANELGGK